MLVSYNWLQHYFDKKLPAPEKVAELFTFHAFEVEGMERLLHQADVGKKPDTIFDIKVLPDRAHYALSHRGIAYELAAILDLKIKPKLDEMYPALPAVQKTRELKLKVENKQLCRRHTGRVIENISIAPSPAWLKEKLEAIGQRSINSIVDATNFVTFDIGQPIHAFDADKVKGELVVRSAHQGEKITLLDGREVALPAGALVIADDEGPLDIAGIKGGKRAIISESTKNIILEAANFDPGSIRRTSTLTGIRSDASKRFENEITPEFAGQGMELVTSLIMKMNPDAKMGEFFDLSIQKPAVREIAFSAEGISSQLGITISEKEIVSILGRLDISIKKDSDKDAKSDALIAIIPAERLDLTIPADLTEEVGRLYGYENVTPKMLPKSSAQTMNKRFYWEQKIRAILASEGFSEVYTHTLVASGPVEIRNPLASDKCALRADLSKGIEKALELNAHNAPLLGFGFGLGLGGNASANQVRIFEIGNVFNGNGEHLSLAVAVGDLKKGVKKKKGETTVNEQIRELREKLIADLAVPNISTLCTIDDTGGLINLNGKHIGIINNIDGVMEFNLDAVIDVLPDPAAWDLSIRLSHVKYAKISSYPFALRDVAVFVPTADSAGNNSGNEVAEKEVRALIMEQAGSLLVRETLFDIFTKKFPDGTSKTSYAFNLVFQSLDRTLSDEEVTASMRKIYDAMTARGWQVR